MTTPFPKVNSMQSAENSILDYFYRQVYLGNGFILANLASLADTNEHNEILISNPSTNSKSLFFFINRLGASGAVTSRIYYNPTVSANGTPTIPINLRPAYSTLSSALSFTAPTISAVGTNIDTTVCGGAENESKKMIIIDPGFSILVTLQATTATITVNQELIWYEI